MFSHRARCYPRKDALLGVRSPELCFCYCHHLHQSPTSLGFYFLVHKMKSLDGVISKVSSICKILRLQRIRINDLSVHCSLMKEWQVSMDMESCRPKSWLCHVSAGWPWASYSICFSFSVFHLKIDTMLFIGLLIKIQWGNVSKPSTALNKDLTFKNESCFCHFCYFIWW